LAVKNDDEPFTRIDVHEAKEMIDSGDVQVIDSREPDEHAEGHVPGSLLIPHMQTLPDGKSGQRSAVAAEFAAALGLTELYNVEGGHDGWRESGYDLES